MVQCEGVLYGKLQGSQRPRLYVLLYIMVQATGCSQMIKVPVQNKTERSEKGGLALPGNTELRQKCKTWSLRETSTKAVSGDEVWSWWPILIISPPLVPHDPLVSPPAPSLLAFSKQISQRKVKHVEVENSICKKYLWKCIDLVDSWMHNCNNMIT